MYLLQYIQTPHSFECNICELMQVCVLINTETNTKVAHYLFKMGSSGVLGNKKIVGKYHSILIYRRLWTKFHFSCSQNGTHLP